MKCTFCGTEIPRGQGLMYVKRDGSIIYFDSGKCQVNMLTLKRKQSKLKWARAGMVIKTSKKAEGKPAEKTKGKKK